MTSGPVVIVGAGHAGFQLGMSLRQNGFGERIVLLNDEGHLPYQRPPLSKAYLKGTGGPDTPSVRPEKFYHEQKIAGAVHPGAALDRPEGKLHLASGRSLDFRHSALATRAPKRLRDLSNNDLEDI